MYRLLIADDEPLIRRGIQKLLNLKSLQIKEIYEAATGEEALEVFEKFHPDIVLLDINMPKMDGLTVAKKIKLLVPETKIAMITGYNYFDYAQTAIKIGVEDYILKPVSKKDISEIILKLVHTIEQERKHGELEKILQKISVTELPKESKDISKEKDYRTCIQQMMEQYYIDSQFSLTYLAEQIHLSPGYLSAIFKKIFGVPFQDYLLQKRMEKARILLLTTALKNYEIAEQVGFEDVNYFGTKFKKYYNYSPKQYKEMVTKNENE